MYRFTDMVSDLNILFEKFKIYYVLLDLVIIFMASYAVIIFSGIHRICADITGIDIIMFPSIGTEITTSALCALVLATMITVTALVVILMLACRRHTDTCATIGTVYHELDEPLKTAHDNPGIKNVVMDDLADGIAEKMDGITYSSFLDQKRITSRIVAVIVMALIIISLAVADFYVIESVDGMKLPVVMMKGDGIGDGAEAMDIEGAGAGGDIYGEPSVASIEGTDLDLVMYTGVGSEFSIREVETQTQEFRESPPFPVEPVAAEAPELNPSENSDLVKRYFEELAAAG